MEKKNKIIRYSVLLVIGLLTFILEIFVFKKPDGVLVFIICIVSIYLILANAIKLCRLSSKFENGLIMLLDAVMWLP